MMKCKLTLWMFFLVAVLWTTDTIGQSMIIQSSDGTESTNQLSLLKKFSFTESNLLLNFVSGSDETMALSGIRKVYFKEVPVIEITGVNTTDKSIVSVFPNPVVSTLYFQNLPSSSTVVSVYSIDGLLVKQSQLTSGSISVSELSKGLYMVKVNNQVIKISKL